MKIYKYIWMFFLLWMFGCQNNGLNQLTNQINIQYVENDTSDHVGNNFYVPLEVEGVVIAWESNSSNVVFEHDRGIITKTLEAQNVTITATFRYKNNTHKKHFDIVIIKEEILDESPFDFTPILDKITIPQTTNKDIDLPLLIDGVTIRWSSSHIDSLSNEGKVTQKDDDVLVTLTALLEKDDDSKTVSYNIQIEKLETTVLEITFAGVNHRNYTMGDVIPNYLEGITALGSDTLDYTTHLKADDSLVNLEEVGIYIVYIYVDFDPTIQTFYTLTVIENEVISFYGVKDITYHIGDEAPNFLEGISAKNNHGVDYTDSLEANTSSINLTKTGVYVVSIYLSFDTSINTSYTITVKYPPTNFTGYYESLDGLTGQALVDALVILLNDTGPYETTTYGEARYILKESDVWVGYNTDYINVIYTDTLRGSSSSGFPFDGYALPIWDVNNDGTNSTWNREHVWAKSLFGTGDYNPGVSTRGIASDMHNLRAADTNVNSTRGNNKFINQVSVSGGFGNYNQMWYPGDTHRGDVARILFYMDIRWGNDTILSKIGDLDTLIAWHEIDPVDEFEIHRNEVIYTYQNNRNPFIDHPELVDLIYNPNYTSFEMPLSIIQTMLSSFSMHI